MLQILFDFNLLFEPAHSNGLLGEVWDAMKSKPYQLLKNTVDGSKIPLKDDSLFDFLNLLKFLPSFRSSFDKSLGNFIKFSEVIYLHILLLDKCLKLVYIFTECK